MAFCSKCYNNVADDAMLNPRHESIQTPPTRGFWPLWAVVTVLSHICVTAAAAASNHAWMRCEESAEGAAIVSKA
jgi:hypothetical protein